jgi:uncharacterized membrane protein YoaK (UPF0700 family)
MAETNLMHGWVGIVESAALVAIVILAMGIMVRAVKPSDVTRHLGSILCIVILLLVLPAIMVNAWSTMSYWQHLGIIVLGIMIGLSLRSLRQTRKKR